LNRITQIISDILDVPPESINLDSGPHNVVQWDSATHIDIILCLEAEYAVTFSMDEIVEVMSVAAIKDCLERKGVDLK
jgi:acyl carrier protein